MSAEGRRPVEEWEREHLLNLSGVITAARLNAGKSLSDIAIAAGLDYSHLRRVIAGDRRTRASTLARVAACLTNSDEEARHLHEQLVHAAGPVLAPESTYEDRVARRRARRLQRAEHEEAQAQAPAPKLRPKPRAAAKTTTVTPKAPPTEAPRQWRPSWVRDPDHRSR